MALPFLDPPTDMKREISCRLSDASTQARQTALYLGSRSDQPRYHPLLMPTLTLDV